MQEVETKYCYKCKTTLPVTAFNWKYKSRGITQSECRICQKKNHRERYLNNKQEYIIKAAERKAKILQWVTDCKTEKGCTNCGENHPAVLDFHHIENKDIEISQAAAKGLSVSKIAEEIKKCIVLCSNCHRKHHWEERQSDNSIL